jgi:hypothetical protein
MGRIATKNVYLRTGDFNLNAIDDIEYCSYISVAPHSYVFGGYLDIINVKGNPFDEASDYITPDAAIAIGSHSIIQKVIVKYTVPADADINYYDQQVIKNLSN